jgi:hypothetical protein
MPSIIHAFLSKIRDSIAAAVYNKLYYSERAQHLTYLALNSKEKGVVDCKIDGKEVIVSLTSHSRRIYEAYLAIESIMQGSIKPNRFVLCLSKDIQDEKLPQTLLNQNNRGLEIRYTEDIGSYKKLIPILKEAPDSIIISIDDDILYPFDTLELLLSAHQKHPDCICANRVMDVSLDNQGNPTSLMTWKELEKKDRISKLNFFEGAGAVLYPPHCFTPEVLNQSVFMKICPTADDVWLNCMARLSKTFVVSACSHYPHFPLLINESIQDSALWRINSNHKDLLNDKQLRAVMQKYNLSYAE